MKRFINLLSIVAVITFASSVFAQSTVTSSVGSSATIMTGISVSSQQDLLFGNLVSSPVAGTAARTDAAGATLVLTGGVSQPGTTGTIQPAAFNLAGDFGATVNLTGTATAITLTSGANTMVVTLTTPASPITLSGTGTATVYIGGSVAVGANQAAGTYTNVGGITLTATYN